MNHSTRSPKLIAIAALVAALALLSGCPSQGFAEHTLLGRVRSLETALESMQADLQATQAELVATQSDLAKAQTDLADAQTKLAFFRVQPAAMDGLNGPNLIVEGCNVHIRSGSGDTADSAGLTGLGNLIIGYNEQPAMVVDGRLGSHNLVIGMEHEYPNYAGLVAGFRNVVSGASASVVGGNDNMASGNRSSITGGAANQASGLDTSVTGGTNNEASGLFSSVSGGAVNTASGDRSSVRGGSGNEARGLFSSVSGGNGRTAAGSYDWVAGSLSQDD